MFRIPRYRFIVMFFMALFPACSQAGDGARQGGEILFERGYGFADREAGRVNTPDTPYDIGSLVKEMTFLAIYQLDERGYFWAPERGVVIIVFSNDSQHGASRIIGKVWSIVRDATKD